MDEVQMQNDSKHTFYLHLFFTLTDENYRHPNYVIISSLL